MPATSKKQRRAMAIAEHHPEKLYKRNKGLSDMTKEQLRDLGTTLSQWIYEADSAKGSLPMVWLQIARYNGDDPASYDTAPDSGEVPIHRPFISIRTDTLLSQMRGVIAAPNPLMLCESADGDDLLSSAMERILTRQWEFGGMFQRPQARLIDRDKQARRDLGHYAGVAQGRLDP